MDEYSIPIDIHANKLLDWLVSRRHCSKDWVKSLTTIRQMIVKALQDMPEHEEIARILSSGQQLNYYTCKEIVQVLEKTEADTKNFFGYYSSQRMKDWQEVVKMYEKDNVYLGEIAQIIVRNVTYEIPSLRKQVSKADAMIDTLRKKQTDAVKRSNLMQAEYSSFAAQLGIKGEDVKKELTQQLSQFPALISEVTDKLVGLKNVLDFYKHFVAATAADVPPLCPLIDYVIQKGNTTYFEYVNGEKPDQIEEASSESPMQQEESDGIDFGEGIDYGDGGIDFGDNGNGSGSAGTSASNGDSFVHITGSDAASKRSSVEEILWDPEPGNESCNKVARGTYAMSVLEVRETRDIIVTELYELQFFLQQRSFEANQTDQQLVELLMGPQLVSLSNESGSTCEDMLRQVSDVLTLVTSDRLKMLHTIRENPSFTETISRKLQQKTELAAKALAQSQAFRVKEREVQEEKMNIIQQIPVLINFTSDLENRLSEDISHRYKNRLVNIMSGSRLL